MKKHGLISPKEYLRRAGRHGSRSWSGEIGGFSFKRFVKSLDPVRLVKKGAKEVERFGKRLGAEVERIPGNVKKLGRNVKAEARRFDARVKRDARRLEKQVKRSYTDVEKFAKDAIPYVAMAAMVVPGVNVWAMAVIIFAAMY